MAAAGFGLCGAEARKRRLSVSRCIDIAAAVVGAGLKAHHPVVSALVGGLVIEGLVPRGIAEISGRVEENYRNITLSILI